MKNVYKTRSKPQNKEIKKQINKYKKQMPYYALQLKKPLK